MIDLMPVIGLVPIIIGLVAVFRKVGLTTRFAPIMAVALGIVGAVSLSEFSAPNVIVGILTGLSAAGLYSGTKTTVGV